MAKFPELPWPKVVQQVEKALFRIETHTGFGSGFAFSMSSEESSKKNGVYALAIATARHVVEDIADLKQTPKIIRHLSGENLGDSAKELKIVPIGAKAYDSALILAKFDRLVFKESDLLPTLPSENTLARGVEIGCLGFPGIAYPEACFFGGRISGFVTEPSPAYLVDGVAVNGVSGGPVFDNRCHVIGFMSAYIPNRLDKLTTLPGLSSVVPIPIVTLFMQQALGARLI